MGQTGDLVGTTFLGALDYYNTKPPLNVWLIALSFAAFGINLVSLRLVSAISAWLTVAVLLDWTRRTFGPAVALFSGLVLATSFGFVYVHSGRSAETDALFTLLVLLTVVTLWAEERHPWQRVWLGPLAAGTFLLRGMAVLMPAAIILAAAIGRKRERRPPVQATALAALLFVVPVATWAFARWRIDEWRFFDLMVNYDFVARTLTVIEEHPGTPLYYLDILRKHHYDWLLAAAAALLLVPDVGRRVHGGLVRFWRGDNGLAVLLVAWAGVTFLIPTVMRTKLPWYLNPFYPAFALGVGWLVVHGLSVDWRGRLRRRGAVLAGVVVVAFGVAEGKLLWYSYQHRDVGNSPQALLLGERQRLKDRRVFFDEFVRADIFVAGAIVGAKQPSAVSLETFWSESRPGDCLVAIAGLNGPRLHVVRSGGRRSLYCRRE
jgi:4-amino-4-deoxy-L-arabinose transferase-like glycosyltransferase